MIKNIHNCELRLGDCNLLLDTLIEDNIKVDYVLTSPPYNRKRNDKYALFCDNNHNYYDFCKLIIDKLLQITNKHIFFNIQANYYNKKDIYKLIGHYAEHIVDVHIWVKTNPMPASGESVTNSYEYILVLGKTPLKVNKTYTKNVLTSSINTYHVKGHKAIMKLDVAQHFIDNYTKDGDVILDCFMGTGTTGVACLFKDRRFIGVELIEEYYNHACERITKEGAYDDNN